MGGQIKKRELHKHQRIIDIDRFFPIDKKNPRYDWLHFIYFNPEDGLNFYVKISLQCVNSYPMYLIKANHIVCVSNNGIWIDFQENFEILMEICGRQHLFSFSRFISINYEQKQWPAFEQYIMKLLVLIRYRDYATK